MRIAFLDESGRSQREPTLVVGGVLVHADRSYRRIEAALHELVTEVIPEQERQGFTFHATDLFHGGPYFVREKWPKEARHSILMRLASLPAAFCLPVIYGHVGKAEHHAALEPQFQGKKKHAGATLEVVDHMTAFTRAVIAAERQMRLYPRDEVCMVIAEDTDTVKEGVKAAHACLKDPREMSREGFSEVEGLPLARVVDTTHFAAKRDCQLLQLADVCAFLLMRRLRRDEQTQPFFEAIAPQLYWRADDFGERLGSERITGGRLY